VVCVYLRWSSHPAKALLDAGCSVSLNSDDPSVFASSLTAELALGGGNGAGMGLSVADLARCTLNAAAAAFVDDK
jgi:adenosine deaminase